MNLDCHVKKALSRPTHAAIDFLLLYLNAFPVKKITSAFFLRHHVKMVRLFLKLLTPLTFKETIFKASDEILTSMSNNLQI